MAPLLERKKAWGNVREHLETYCAVRLLRCAVLAPRLASKLAGVQRQHGNSPLSSRLTHKHRSPDKTYCGVAGTPALSAEQFMRSRIGA